MRPPEPSPPVAYQFLHDNSNTAYSFSLALAIVAGAALLANCLLTSPSQFSQKHYEDTTLLRPIVSAVGLFGKFPTSRGVEIRNLFFYVGACLLALIAGARLMTVKKGPGLTLDDLLDLKARCAGPYFWWFLLLLTGFFSSYYSNAPEMCFGQLKIRLISAAWWAPLGALLAPRHVRGLCTALVIALALTAALGIAYHLLRDDPGRRLAYPLGNELWLGACLLPGILLAIALAMGRYSPTANGKPTNARLGRTLFFIALAAIIAAALHFTRSRSAQAGLIAGVLVALCFWFQGLARRLTLLFAIVLALGGSFWVNRVLQSGGVEQRAASIRSRLLYEWPFAIHLFLQKPVAGNGDGAYSMLAGKLERDEQLEDPATIRFDEWSWPGHAHNEFLELMSDLGLVGLLAWVLALGLTLYRALQFCDRCPSDCVDRRWLTIGLAAALVGMVIDQCFEPSNREPGVPAVFFTVWACLWAMCRQEQPLARGSMGDATANEILRPSTLRIAGACVVLASAALGWYSVENWRGCRARFDAMQWMESGDFPRAESAAAFASDRLLDPFQRAQARMIEAWAGSLIFDKALARPGPPSEQEIRQSGDVLRRLVKLDDEVPRFLRVSRIATELYLNRARAFGRLGDKENERDSQAKFVSALRQNQKDEPFLVDRVFALWKAVPDATAMERLWWLRCLMRGGETDDNFIQLFRTLPGVKDFGPTLSDLYTVAMQESQRPRSQWRDRLAPETFRAAALVKALAGDFGEAQRQVQIAGQMYATAGHSLAAAHAAAIHEEVRYQFAADPVGHTDDLLARLAEAHSLSERRIDASQPLPGRPGETRLRILIAAGRETAARDQLTFLGVPNPELNSRLALAMADIASRYLVSRGQLAAGLDLARRSVELVPESPLTHRAMAIALLGVERQNEAEAEAARFIEL
ncbi:MAG TPA: O-antigen ligase family protein, partial [Phycisphaerae bacterium]|nr:O-antigen ligase family protein [Phycisphaerae bacterium]